VVKPRLITLRCSYALENCDMKFYSIVSYFRFLLVMGGFADSERIA